MEDSVKAQSGHDAWLAMENAKKDYIKRVREGNYYDEE